MVGMGQLGSIFSEGFLEAGRAVIPVRRGERIEDACAMAAPACIVIATGEDDLDGALSGVPPALRDRVVLLQNELRPHLWKDAGIEEPSVTIVWFERKAGKPPHVVLPSFTWGPMAPLLESVYAALGLEFRRISRVAELAHELASK